MRTTVKTWLKSQEKAKTEGQEKPEPQEETAVVSNTEKMSNGGVSHDVGVDLQAATYEPQLPNDLGDSEETPSAALQPSIEVNRCRPNVSLTWLTSSLGA